MFEDDVDPDVSIAETTVTLNVADGMFSQSDGHCGFF